VSSSRGPRRQTLCALVDFASGGRKRCFVDTMTIVGGQPPAVGDRVSVRMPRGGLRVGKVQSVASWSMRKASSLEGIGIVEGPATTTSPTTSQPPQQPQPRRHGARSTAKASTRSGGAGPSKPAVSNAAANSKQTHRNSNAVTAV